MEEISVCTGSAAFLKHFWVMTHSADWTHSDLERPQLGVISAPCTLVHRLLPSRLFSQPLRQVMFGSKWLNVYLKAMDPDPQATKHRGGKIWNIIGWVIRQGSRKTCISVLKLKAPSSSKGLFTMGLKRIVTVLLITISIKYFLMLYRSIIRH